MNSVLLCAHPVRHHRTGEECRRLVSPQRGDLHRLPPPVHSQHAWQGDHCTSRGQFQGKMVSSQISNVGHCIKTHLTHCEFAFVNQKSLKRDVRKGISLTSPFSGVSFEKRIPSNKAVVPCGRTQKAVLRQQLVSTRRCGAAVFRRVT